jgi:hypothetical protein
LQDYKERRCQDQQKNMEELVHFLQEYTWGLHPFNLQMIWFLQITWQLHSQI